MIELKAKLVREQTAVFLAGEMVDCFITFTNIQQQARNNSSATFGG